VSPTDKTGPLLSIAGLVVHFHTPQGTVRAVDGVSLTLNKGETLGLVGESGCGKSTLGKAIVGLVKLTEGSITLDGTELAGLSRREMLRHRARLQMIFQDPYASLNPRLPVGKIIEEPLSVHGIGKKADRRAAVVALAERVGLRPESPAPWRSIPRSSFATNRFRRSTSRCRRRSSICSAICSANAACPICSSRTISRSCSISPIASR
jgi:ABC-type glutathione transport system ATPase component